MNSHDPGHTLLGGKVTLTSLPEFTGPQGPDAPAAKRLHLAQGELAQVWNSEDGAHYIAVIELREGAIRGNHFHRAKLEFVYIISGKARFKFEDTQTGDRAEIEAPPGSLVRIQPQVAHAILTDSNGWALEFSPGAYQAEDVHRQSVATDPPNMGNVPR